MMKVPEGRGHGESREAEKGRMGLVPATAQQPASPRDSCYRPWRPRCPCAKGTATSPSFPMSSPWCVRGCFPATTNPSAQIRSSDGKGGDRRRTRSVRCKVREVGAGDVREVGGLWRRATVTSNITTARSLSPVQHRDRGHRARGQI